MFSPIIIPKEEYEKAIRCYEGYGLVTRKMVPGMDIRSRSRAIFEAMIDHGCKDIEKAQMFELVINDYEDYYNVIFNTDLFTSHQEVQDYIIKGNW